MKSIMLGMLAALVVFGVFAMEEKPVKRLTPILVVEEIEPCLNLWVDRLGFEKTMEVPAGDKLGFVALERDGREIMFQTRASVEKEVETAGLHEALRTAGGSSVLFIEVEELAAIQKAVEGMEILVPYRETFYGSKELWLREPGGHIIGFAEMQ